MASSSTRCWRDSTPFQRVTAGDTLNAIIHDEPAELSATDPEIPALARLVRHCLEKQPDERFQNFRDLLFDLDNPPPSGGAVPSGPHRRSRRAILAAAGLVALAAAVAIGVLVSPVLRRAPTSPVIHRVLPMTDIVGLEEFPVDLARRKHGGLHGQPRAVVGRSSCGFSRAARHAPSPAMMPIIKLRGGYSMAVPSCTSRLRHPAKFRGRSSRIPTLGGLSQRLIASIGGGDVSRSGRLACFRLEGERIQLVTSALDGSDIRQVATLQTRHYRYPRWSPDNQWIAFQAGDGFRWNIYNVSAGGGTPVNLTNDDRFIEGLTWLPDSSGIVHASSRGSTVPYLPPLALWEVSLVRGRPLRQLTPAEAWYEQPDVHENGLVSATRLKMRFDLWKLPDRRA